MRRALAAISAVFLLTGCEAAVNSGTTGTEPPAKAAKGSFGVSPLDNPDGTEPGLGVISSAADKKSGRAIIEKVRTAGRGPKTGYDRDKFGTAWKDGIDGVPLARNGCDTRNDLLKRDGKSVKYRQGSKCVVIEMTLNDPYTGKTISFEKAEAAKVQIDHMMPLSYDWQMGASRWSETKREQIANDPLNLIPVDGPSNGSKSDSGPASWLPPYKPIRCSYAVRFAQVAIKYELPVTTADKQTMKEQCA